jgi:hypothetical protein
MRKERILIWFKTASLSLAAASLLFPAGILSGSLDPSNPGEPNTKNLEEVPRTSSQEDPARERFELVLEGTAVRDKETGVVWEQSPDPTTRTWENAVKHCESLELAGRKQWRLPTIDELASLVDASVLGSPKLPSGHPFDTNCRLGGCVQSSFYWSGTPCADNAAHAWLACFCNGSVTRSDKSYDNHVWCAQVENGHGAD